MTKVSFPSDTIALKGISTGGNSAGNGGSGHNSGDISSTPTINFDPSNKAYGSDVHVNTGDKVSQKADWEAGGANAKAEWFAKAHGGTATSNGSQNSDSGHDTSKVYADTTAHQSIDFGADQSQSVAAGIGGDGGDGNAALGGNVDIKASLESVNLNDVLNHSGHFDADLHV